MTEALKRKFIQELRGYWSSHPLYPDLPDHIIGKYSFRERPSTGIVVKTSGGSHVMLSADNYIGIIESYVHLARYKNKPGTSIEWVREDSIAIQNNNGVFPTPAGVYYVELTEDDEFYVDALTNIYNEIMTKVDDLTYSMSEIPLNGSIRVFEMPARYQLTEGEYTLEKNSQGNLTGSISIQNPLSSGRYLVVDYKHPEDSKGPFKLTPGFVDNTAIPGVVLAFGRRCQKGDIQAVMVDDIRRPAAQAYGGKWDLTLDFDVVARDVYAQQEIADQTVIYLWGVLRPQLSSEGIEISEISLGGESEEIYDENGDDYFYNSSFSITVSTDWEIHVPISVFLRQVTPNTQAYAQYLATLSDDQLRQANTTIRQANSAGLELMRDPFFTGNIATYEMMS